MNKKVSVIVPVYNSENFLDRCIQSVINQSYSNIELLLINDGSTDGSRRICENYASKDCRIKVFNISNGGVSNARNIGLENASGDYIQFLDSDDSMQFNMIELLCSQIKDADIDMVICSYTRETPYRKQKDKFRNRSGIYNAKEYLQNSMKEVASLYYGVVWNKLYKKDIIKENEIFFRKDMKLSEDWAFNLEYIIHVKRVKAIKERLYVYDCTRCNNLSNRKSNINSFMELKSDYENRKKIFDILVKTLKKMELYECNKKRAFSFWKEYYFCELDSLKNDVLSLCSKDKSEWRKILNSDVEIIKYINSLSEFSRLRVYMKIRKEKMLYYFKLPVKFLIQKTKKC